MPQTELGRLGGKTTSINHLAWEKLPDLRPASYPGVQTSRDGALVGTDRAAVEARIKRYFDDTVSDALIAVDTSIRRFPRKLVHGFLSRGYDWAQPMRNQ
jgi:hypothetical protein